MLPDRVSNPRPLTYESGALPIALRGPANLNMQPVLYYESILFRSMYLVTLLETFGHSASNRI